MSIAPSSLVISTFALALLLSAVGCTRSATLPSDPSSQSAGQVSMANVIGTWGELKDASYDEKKGLKPGEDDSVIEFRAPDEYWIVADSHQSDYDDAQPMGQFADIAPEGDHFRVLVTEDYITNCQAQTKHRASCREELGGMRIEMQGPDRLVVISPNGADRDVYVRLDETHVKIRMDNIAREAARRFAVRTNLPTQLSGKWELLAVTNETTDGTQTVIPVAQLTKFVSIGAVKADRSESKALRYSLLNLEVITNDDGSLKLLMDDGRLSSPLEVTSVEGGQLRFMPVLDSDDPASTKLRAEWYTYRVEVSNGDSMSLIESSYYTNIGTGERVTQSTRYEYGRPAEVSP